MSYLSALRLHFQGGFQASPSTINNVIANYDNATFDPGQSPLLWNPNGDHRFVFRDCRVTAARLSDGSAVGPGSGDPILTLELRSAGAFAAKLVDLDPYQQLVSTIYGLNIVLRTASGPALLRAAMTPAPFTDIWVRGTTGGGDERAAAMYQSTLKDLQWGDFSASPFLQQLRDSAGDGLLSIKFNLDGYSMGQGPGFTLGRVAGTIGPARADEPRHFVRGRHFNGLVNNNPDGLFVVPRDRINFCVAVLDEAARKVRLDLGNALPTSPSGGAMADIGALSLVCDAAGDRGATRIPLGTIDYRAAAWYEQTAGIVELPPGRPLTDAELAAVRDHPLALVREAGGPPITAVREAAGGTHLRADMFAARLNPGEQFPAEFYASRLGRPLPGARIVMSHRVMAADPPIGEPREALTFEPQAECDAAGRASVPLQAGDPGNPRGYIDGQVYYVDYALEGTTPLNPSDYLSVLVWDSFQPEDPPTWHGSMQPIFRQYANLYPMMNQIIDMSSYEAVSDSREAILQVIGLSPLDPHHMPVTRDLSEAKLQAMTRWLTDLGPDGSPLLGTPGAGPLAMAAVPAAGPDRAAAPAGAADESLHDHCEKGSKGLAAEYAARSRRRGAGSE